MFNILKIDQNINIAFFGGLASNVRPEKAELRHPVGFEFGLHLT